MSRGNVTTTMQGYGFPHQRLRKSWVPRVEAGEVACGKCGRLIFPGTLWDLAHPFDRKELPPAPWHRKCNRSYAATVTKRRRQAQREGTAVPSAQPPIKWSRVWGSAPPQGYILTSDPTGTVHYPDDDPRSAQPVPGVVSLNEAVEQMRRRESEEPDDEEDDDE